MPRRRLTPDARRRQIVEASLALFARKGFSGTTSRELARAAGVSEALIFRLFPTKHALYAAIIQRKIAETETLYFPPGADRESDRDLFRRIGLTLVTRIRDDRTLLRLLFFSALEGHTLSDMFFETRVARVIGLLRDRIAAGVRAGRYRAVNPYLAARAYTGSLVQYVLAQELFGMKKKSSPPFGRVVDTFLDLFLNGLEK
jgi:AcrR family transcriptional regulator